MSTDLSTAAALRNALDQSAEKEAATTKKWSEFAGFKGDDTKEERAAKSSQALQNALNQHIQKEQQTNYWPESVPPITANDSPDVADQKRQQAAIAMIQKLRTPAIAQPMTSLGTGPTAIPSY